ncbi:hypothetical protein GCM10010149_48990 [Nonomuraea roseoviolacea subsp. roseoviolacea]
MSRSPSRVTSIVEVRPVKAGLSPLADALFDNAEAHLAADAKLLEDVQRLLDD